MFDLSMATLAVLILAMPMLCIAILVRVTSNGPALYWSKRVGQNNSIFSMPKFRTMRINAPQLATHLLTDSKNWITTIGHLLRVTSLDELPQLFNILTGEMSLVGPRPALFNQDDLIALRTARDVHRLIPGLTGWAQINGRDELTIPEKVELDVQYLKHRSFVLDLKIVFLTAIKMFRSEGIAQAGEERTQRDKADAAHRTAA